MSREKMGVDFFSLVCYIIKKYVSGGVEMANQYTRESAPRRKKSPVSGSAYRSRRIKRRNYIRFDLIFLAAVTLVVLLAVAMPRQQTDDNPGIVETTDPPTDPITDPSVDPMEDEPSVLAPIPGISAGKQY